MGLVDHFTYGWLNPAVACAMAVLGCLLGLILATKAQGRGSTGRTRLLNYATLAIAGTGVWVPQLIALFGLTIRQSVLRYDARILPASLGMTLVLVGAGLFVACTARARVWRLLLGGALIGAGVAAANYAALLSLRIAGSITFRSDTFVISVAVAMASTCVMLWFLFAVRRLAMAIGAAAVLGVAFTATHYIAVASVQVHVSADHPPIVGLSPILLVAPVILFSCAMLAMLWFFTVGAATRQDLRAIFAAQQDPIEIEHWMIEEVTARIAVDIVPEEPSPDFTPAGGPPGPRPQPGLAAPWRGMPAWGSGRPGLNNGRGNLPLDVRYRQAPPAPLWQNHTPPGSPAVANEKAEPAAPAPTLVAAVAGGPDRYPPTVALAERPPDPAAILALPEQKRSRWRNRRR